MDDDRAARVRREGALFAAACAGHIGEPRPDHLVVALAIAEKMRVVVGDWTWREDPYLRDLSEEQLGKLEAWVAEGMAEQTRAEE
jgi:hypothetical protein